jgi:hypothetical protein
MTDPTPAAAGWYHDPDLTGGQRWWTGTTWTDHIALPPPPQQQWPSTAPAPIVNNIIVNGGYRGKSVGVAFLLTFLFGPLGMFYSTVGGALIMCLIAVLTSAGTAGAALFIVWPISILWGCLAASNRR